MNKEALCIRPGGKKLAAGDGGGRGARRGAGGMAGAGRRRAPRRPRARAAAALVVAGLALTAGGLRGRRGGPRRAGR